MDRRQFLQVSAGTSALVSGAAAASAETPRYQDGASPFPLSMNTSTIRPASLEDKIKATAEAGYDAIEPWIDDLANYEKDGGNLEDLGKRIADQGLFVTNVIGLWSCMPPTREEFDASLEATRTRMRQSAAIGSRHVAAIPAPDREDFDLKWGAQCYRELLEIGQQDYGITVAFEFIGFLKGVHRLGQACAIALDANHRDACLVMDTFHLFRGDSGFDSTKHLQADFLANFHWNDVPAEPAREEQGDGDRILPGDGVLPLVQLLKDLKAIGFKNTLSLELFNKKLYEQDPFEVAKIGKDKMLAGIDAAGI